MSDVQPGGKEEKPGGLSAFLPTEGSPEYAALAPLILKIRAAGDSARGMRLLQFREIDPVPGSVLFLGDSITEGGLWSEWFSDVRSYNRGIGGDTIDGVASRLDSALRSPALVSLLIGTNDLSSWHDVGDTDEIAVAFADLVSRIRTNAPEAVLLINAVMPRTSDLAPSIQRLNESYRDIAAQFGATFVDTWTPLAEADGTIRSDCSLDALHLSGEGYRRWVEILRPHIEGVTNLTRTGPQQAGAPE